MNLPASVDVPQPQLQLRIRLEDFLLPTLRNRHPKDLPRPVQIQLPDLPCSIKTNE